MDPLHELWLEEHRIYATNQIAIYVINHAIFIRDENGPDLRAIGAITAITEKISWNTICLSSKKKNSCIKLKFTE